LAVTTQSEPSVISDAAAGQEPCAPAAAPSRNVQAEALVTRRGGKFVLYDPRLGLLVSHADLAAGYALLEKDRAARLAEMAEAGITHWLPEAESRQPGQGAGMLSRLKPFLIKAVVVSALFFVFLNALSGALRDAGYGLEKKLEGLSNWEPDQVEWHRARAEKIAAKLGPTIRELMGMFRDPAPGATAMPAQAEPPAEPANVPKAEPSAQPRQ
jgi:hypothetical protein